MKISYNNKQNINTNNSIPNENKVSSNDMNNIKETVNTNYDEFTALSGTVGTNSEDITNIKDRLDTAEDNISNNADDIDTLEGKVQTLETGIGNVYTKTETDNLLNDKANTSDIPTNLNQLSNANTKFVNETQLSNAVGIETTARENADTNLQNQIDGITASSDVVDIVGTYQELLNYDTQHLGDNDIIKVLQDSTHNNSVSYYRWNKNDEEWTYVGSEGPFYTKGETDTLLNNKVNKEEGKGLSTNDFTNDLKSKLEGIEDNAEVNKIETIKVNNVAQTITNKTVNLNVPTKTSDLNNDSGFITKSVSDLDNYTNNTTLQSTYQTKSNLVTSVSSSSTDTQYPSAKLFYDTVGDISTILQTLDTGSGV